MKDRYDAVVIGSGPNGLAAAVTLAREGASVLVVEAKETAGGGARSSQVTLPGFTHDICSAIHPTAVVSPFFRQLPLADFGVDWIYPPASVAHPLDNGQVAVLERSVERTAQSLGRDKEAYLRLFAPLVSASESLLDELLKPLGVPKHPLLMARFGMSAWRSAVSLARSRFRTKEARALLAGNAGHSILPLDRIFSGSFGLVLMVAGHAIGWPMARGGSQKIADALAAYLGTLGGEIVCSFPVSSLRELPRADAYFFDTAPAHLAEIVKDELPAGYRERLKRFRHGPGVFKVDWALDGRVPWTADRCNRAATVHVGGTLEEVAASEKAVWLGEHPEKPFVLFVQHSLFDPSRAPEGKSTAWGYCHVPAGSTEDMTKRIEAQIERFAPGFKDRILMRRTMNTADFQSHNPNYVGGDIAGGSNQFPQLFLRPVLRRVPYSTPNPAIFLCSASTPPGGGVHGLCGFFAAQAALRSTLKRRG